MTQIKSGVLGVTGTVCGVCVAPETVVSGDVVGEPIVIVNIGVMGNTHADTEAIYLNVTPPAFKNFVPAPSPRNINIFFEVTKIY